MKSILKRIHHTLLMVVTGVTLFSCATKEKPSWDSERMTYTLPKQGMTLRLPGEKGWVIAPPDSLPDGILFCGTLPNKEIAVMIVADIETHDGTGIRRCGPEYLDAFARRITEQGGNIVPTAYGPVVSELCEFQSRNAVRFHRSIDISVDSVKMKIDYDGYFFDIDDKIYAFIVTSSGDTGSQDRTVDEIFKGLRFME